MGLSQDNTGYLAIGALFLILAISMIFQGKRQSEEKGTAPAPAIWIGPLPVLTVQALCLAEQNLA